MKQQERSKLQHRGSADESVLEYSQKQRPVPWINLNIDLHEIKTISKISNKKDISKQKRIIKEIVKVVLPTQWCRHSHGASYADWSGLESESHEGNEPIKMDNHESHESELIWAKEYSRAREGGGHEPRP